MPLGNPENDMRKAAQGNQGDAIKSLEADGKVLTALECVKDLDDRGVMFFLHWTQRRLGELAENNTGLKDETKETIGKVRKTINQALGTE